MSHLTFNEQWKQVMGDISLRLDIEKPSFGTLIPETLSEIYQHHVQLYVQYLRIFKKLEDCYDQMCHPQKRIELKQTLEAVMGRILEIKDIIVKMDQTEFPILDDILQDLKLIPETLDIPIPRYFVEERAKELEERDKLLNALISQYKMKKETEQTQAETPMTLEEAIRIIQVNERGRQGRLKAKETKELRQVEKDHVEKKGAKPQLDPAEAAIMVQKCFRGHLARKKTKDLRREELQFIGMESKDISNENDPVEKALATRSRRKLLQHQNEQEYQQALVVLKQKIHEQEGPEMKEKMQDEIRQWFITHKEQTGKFPAYPSPSEGGSSIIVATSSNVPPLGPSSPMTQIKNVAETTAAGARSAASRRLFLNSPRASSAPAPSRGTGAGTAPLSPFSRRTPLSGFGKSRQKEDDEKKPAVILPPSRFLPCIQTSVDNYKQVWGGRDESSNFAQKHDPELIKEILRPEVEKELRASVDVLLRVELENLRLSVEGKRRKGKKGDPTTKRTKKKGAKKNKDPTHDRSIESLYGELVSKDIVIRCREVKMSDFIGAYQFMKKNVRNTKLAPSLADVKRTVSEHCILRLGSEFVHKNAPPLKSVLLFGPPGTGKKMLAEAVATETGSVFFDLSPSNIADKESAAELKMLMHVIFKVAKTMAPSVIYIKDSERIFQKDKKKSNKDLLQESENSSPMRVFKKALLAQVKSLKPQERVLVLATSRSPHIGGKGLATFVQKAFFVPLPDYTSRRLLWLTNIKKKGGKVTDALDISTLTRLSEGYSAATIVTAVSETLVATRLQTMERKPLSCNEFLESLTKLPVTKYDAELYQKFQGKVVIKKLKANAEAVGPPTRSKPKPKA